MDSVITQVAPPIYWTPKDVVTACIAGLALVLSLWNAWRSRVDRAKDNLRTVRSQLTEVLLKISDTRMTYRRQLSQSGDSDSMASAKQAARAALGDRLHFLCHQAAFLAAQIPTQVAPIEHALVGLASEDFDDLTGAEEAQVRALSAAKEPKDKAFTCRTLGRLRFASRRPREARDDFAAAVAILSGIPTDDGIDDLVETFLRWAELERRFGEAAAALTLVDRAEVAARRIADAKRREGSLADAQRRGKVVRAAVGEVSPIPGTTRATQT